MKRFILFLAFSFFTILPSLWEVLGLGSLPFDKGWGRVCAQPSTPFGNEWINYSQKYLEFKIVDTGIYRINYSALSQGLNSIGESITSLDPHRIKIFGKGEELYVYIEGENDSSFDNNDFIEFFATGNDGWFDSLLYLTPADQSNPFYSLFNDTATYYLTVSSTENGRRMGVVNFSPSGTTATYFFKEEIISFTDYFYQGEFYGSATGPALPLYKKGKGWFGSPLNSGETFSVSMNSSFAQTQSPQDAEVKIVLAGANGNPHNIKVSYGSSTFTDNFNAYELKKYENLFLPCSTLTSTTVFTFQSLSSGSLPDRTAISHIYMKYPRTFNFSSITEIMMILPPSSSDPAFISASGYPINLEAFIYDLTSHNRIETKNIPGNFLQAQIPGTTERKCFLSPIDNIVYISSLLPVTDSGKFTDYSADKDSAFVIITHPLLMEGALAYRDYRNTDLFHQSLVADIEQLYDQFAYGINKHPLAIKNFCRYLIEKFSVPPQHLFIIGKAISDADFSTRNNSSLYAQNLVPTFGWPGSDVAFSWGMNVNQFGPAIGTGRLAAKTKLEVMNYLEKVSLFEQNMVESTVTQTSIPNKIWMKHAIHFCGGVDATQGNQFCGFLQQYENLLEGDLYGGNVTTISKNSTDPIQVNTDSITKMIEDGVSILTFFGHSSSTYTDMSIGYASDYDFKPGRYPLMIVNGCFSGDIFTTGSESTSENFILTEKKGAIGYIAHTGLGYTGELHNYSNSLYNNISKTSYGKSIGKCIQQGIADNQPVSFIPMATALGMTLHGDPAVKINTHLKPDYAIAPEYVYFSPTDVTTADSSFNMNIVIANLGKTDPDSVSVLIQRILPNGTSVNYSRVIPPVFYKETLTVTLPVDLVNGAGINQFCILVDPGLKIPEISELNNIICNNEITLVIKSGDLVPVYPFNYAVVPNRNIVLKASTSDPFALSKEYIFQIDTTDTYDSPKFKYFTETSPGGVVKWNIDSIYFNLPDSTAFYWRTSPNNPSDYRWREHSFQIISGKTGWGQKHFFQYKKDAFENIEYNRQERKFLFFPQQKGLRCDVWGNPYGYQYDQIQYLINNAQKDYNSATGSQPAMYIAIIDKCSLEPWGTKKELNGITYNPDHDFGNCNNLAGPPGRWWTVEYYFVFQINDPVQMDSMRNLINNKIPEGFYVLAYSFGSGMFTNNPSIWDSSHIQAFKDLGADGIDQITDPFPYIFFGQKGNPGIGKEVFGTAPNAFITLSANMTGCIGNGTITTPVIGPANKWGSLHWKFISNNFTDDTVRIAVLDAVSKNIVKEFSTFNGDITPLYDSVNAVFYPDIKLRANIIQNDSLAPPAQLASWYVLYDEIPEAALNPKRAYSFHASSIQQGDLLKFIIAIENVSNSGMDSLRIKYWVENAQRNVDSVVIKKNGPLPAGNVMFDTISFTTRNLYGNCRFWIEVNPKDSLWQLEQYHFNNIANLGFNSEKDNINPLLDVTFDGIRILNGDIVSPKPEIVIQLKDENKFLALNDTDAFKIFLKDPDQQSTRIYFRINGTEQMRFSKAVLPDNKCKIEYQPLHLTDGIYELRVQGSDASGNDAGDLDYSITFEVINKSTITEILNYPNPFSTSTRFVFTLTGAEIPDYFKIQIITVSGKVIREITRNELGNIHIGRNITDFAWNGTDDYGDPLANGVYLYRVFAKINGELIEHRETNADPFFKKGFGKMYLMR